MINVSFNKGMFPDFLKVGNVIPIYIKKVKNPNNYRPISLLSNIIESYVALANGNFGCGVFKDLQKAFDIVNHDILRSKQNHYDIRGVAFDWFKSYLATELSMQPSIMKDLKSKLKYGIPRGSMLVHLYYFSYIYIYIYIYIMT